MRLSSLGIALTIIAVACGTADELPRQPPATLPAAAADALRANLAASRPHAQHVWRDTAPFNDEGRVVNAYIEIPVGETRKYELDMSTNVRSVDRVMPDDLGGYPINYGFVPQTVSYDGDPFDALVLGPALPGGEVTSGVIVGLMLMEDEKGLDSKVLLSPADAAGRPRYTLTDADAARIAEYFNNYKKHEQGTFSRVPGWASAADGLAHVRTTHAFFRQCPGQAPGDCQLPARNGG